MGLAFAAQLHLQGGNALRALGGKGLGRAPDLAHDRLLDGLFEPLDDDQVRSLHAPALTPQEVAAIAEGVRRAGCWAGLLVAACSMAMMPATCSPGRYWGAEASPRP